MIFYLAKNLAANGVIGCGVSHDHKEPRCNELKPYGCQRRLKIPHFAGPKFPSPGRVVVYSFGCWIQNEIQPVKQRRALVETNLPRNSWPQTHQDDETRGEAEEVLAPGSE